MKKIFILSLGLGLLSPFIMFAQTDATVSASDVNIPPIVITYNAVCASNAVIAHENNQEAIVENRQASTKTATIARRDSLGAAYLLTDKTARDASIKSAHDLFITTQKASDKIAMDASKVENKSFDLTMQGCGAKLPPQTREQMDNQNGPDSNINNQITPNKDLQNNNPVNPNRNIQGEQNKLINQQGDQNKQDNKIKQQDQQGQQTDQNPPKQQNRPWWKFWGN